MRGGVLYRSDVSTASAIFLDRVDQSADVATSATLRPVSFSDGACHIWACKQGPECRLTLIWRRSPRYFGYGCSHVRVSLTTARTCTSSRHPRRLSLSGAHSGRLRAAFHHCPTYKPAVPRDFFLTPLPLLPSFPHRSRAAWFCFLVRPPLSDSTLVSTNHPPAAGLHPSLGLSAFSEASFASTFIPSLQVSTAMKFAQSFAALLVLLPLLAQASPVVSALSVSTQSVFSPIIGIQGQLQQRRSHRPTASPASEGYSSQGPGQPSQGSGYSPQGSGRSSEGPGHSSEGPGHSSEGPSHSSQGWKQRGQG